jgi:AcrR family transcriptional regulator
MAGTERKRLSPQASREAALDAARALLLEAGPAAVTLKAVAARMGRTHANLLHHFGSAAELQQALAVRIAAEVRTEIVAAVAGVRAGEQDPGDVVDRTFDVFDSQGAGALASWMILTGNRDALDPILAAIHALVDEIAAGHSGPAALVHEQTLQVVLMALGDALLGDAMARALSLPRDRAREIAKAQLRAALAMPQG